MMKYLIALPFLLMGFIFITIGISIWDEPGSEKFIPLGAGFLFSVIGIAVTAYNIYKIKLRARLLKTGKLVRAKIAGIEEEKWTSKGRTHINYKLKAEHDGMIFISDYIEKNDIKQTEKYETVNVYIDNDNSKKYYVDLKSVLKKKTGKDPMKNPMWMFVPVFLFMGIMFTVAGVLSVILYITGAIASDATGASVEVHIVLILSVFAVVGLLMLTSGIVIINKQVNKKKMKKLARQTGRMVRANIIGIVEDENVRINRIHPLMLEAEFDGKIFHSEYLKNKEINNLKIDNETVNIYISRENKDFYYIDLDSIKKR